MADTPPTKGKFIATYNDGSGATLFQLKKGKLTMHEEKYSAGHFEKVAVDVLDDFLYWIPLPDNFKFWGEL